MSKEAAEMDPLVSNQNGKCEKLPSSNDNLLKASVEGRAEEVAELISKYGADINAVNREGETPLIAAVNHGHLNTAKVLLEKGSDTGMTNFKGETALHIASREDRKEIVELLLKHSAHVDSETKTGETAVHLVAARGFMTILEKLCDVGADINKKFEQASPLHLAIKNDQIKTAIKLVENGADLSQEDENKNVPLHLATDRANEDADLVKLLVKKDERGMEHKNKDGNTPLHVASAGGHYRSVEFLVDHGARIGVKNNNGDTPFHLACDGGFKVTGAKIIHNQKTLVNVANNEGLLPLHKSVIAGKVKTINLIMNMYENDHNLWIDFVEKNKKLKTCLMDMALDNGNNGAAMSLVNSFHWKTFMMYEQIIGSMKVTPMRRLITDMPNVAAKVMDKCLTRKENQIFYHYELLDDRFSKWKDDETGKDSSEIKDSGEIDKEAQPYVRDICDLKHCHPMTLIANTDEPILIDHPLVRALLRRKWGLSLKIYFSFLIYYATYVSLFSAFMIFSDPPFNGKACEFKNETSSYVSVRSISCNVLAGFVYLFAVIGIIIELIQLALSKFKHYFNIHNLLDWFTYLAPMIVVSNVTNCGYVTHWQWQLGVIGIFITCFNMLFFMRIIPFLGIYIMMILLMLKNFMQFFTIMFLFLYTFALCFFLLLRNQMPFGTPFFAIMKSWVMMVGEMDFTDTFHGHRESIDESDQMHYELLTWALYIAFLVFLSLIIMNLLTSLAVSGVETLQEDSKHKMMILQMRLSLNVEFALPVWLQHRLKCVVNSQRMKIMRSSHISKAWRSIEGKIFGDLCEQDIIKQSVDVIENLEVSDKVAPKSKPLTKKDVDTSVSTKLKTVKFTIKEIDNRVCGLDKTVSEMEKKIGEIHSMLEKMSK